MKRVFLGGTRAESTWREKVEKDLSFYPDIEYFNPVVENWTKECQENEMSEKDVKCNIHLYVITSEMEGVFSIAEAVDSVNNPMVNTIFHVVPDGFSIKQIKSLEAVTDLIRLRGGYACINSDLSIVSKVIKQIKLT